MALRLTHPLDNRVKKLSPCAELHDDMYAVSVFKHIKDLDDVLVSFQQMQDRDLCVNNRLSSHARILYRYNRTLL